MKKFILAVLCLLFCNPVFAADRFWVGGSGTWDASDTTHWAATGGGSGGASVPGVGDNAVFLTSSGSGTVNLTYDVELSGLLHDGSSIQLNANNHVITASNQVIFYHGNFNLGSGLIITDNLDIQDITNLTLTSGAVTVTGHGYLQSATGPTFGALKLVEGAYFGAHQSAPYTVTIGTLTISSAPGTAWVQITPEYTWVVSDFIGNGSSLKSVTAGVAVSITKSSGTVNVYGMELKDTAVSGGATWNAYDSTNVSGNSGWNWLSTNSSGVVLSLSGD